MKSWMERLGLMLAMLAMLLMAAVPAMANHDDECEDGFEWDEDEEECVWVGDDEDFEGIELAELDLEIVCFLDADWDGLHDEDWEDGEDNDWDGEIDEDDIDCFVEED
jgi:hypothetical protein